MRRFSVGLLVFGLCLAAWGAFAEEVPPKPAKLVVSTWGFNLDLIRKNIAEPFQERYGIEIVYDLGNNAARLARLVANKDNPVVDVVHFTRAYAYRAIQEGLLQPYNPDNIPALAEIYEWARDPLGGNYAVGYAVQHLALAYRPDRISPPVTSWKDFWRDDVAGYITLPDMNTTYGPAVLIMCARAWGGSEENLEPGWEKLAELMPRLTTIYRRSSEAITLFQQEEVWLAPIPSFAWGRLEAAAAAAGFPVEQVIPVEGLVGELSVVAVVKGTPNAYWAEKYIDFILSREVQTAQALDLVDSPVNMNVELPPEIGAKLTYGKEIIDALIFFDQAFIAQHLDEWIARWNEIRTQ